MGDGLRYIGVAERRARLALRHRLAPRARVATPEAVADALLALHGSDPATVYLAVGARLADPAATVTETDRALYADRSLVRMHGMRHTVFVFPTESTAVVHASTGLAVAARERATLVKDMAKAGAPDAAWLKEVEESALAALARLGQATAAELAREEPRLREQFVYAAGKPYEGVHTVVTRLLRVLGVEGKVVRGAPGLVDVEPVPLGSGPRARRTSGGTGPVGAAAALADGVRPGHGGRSEVVDGLEGDGRPPGADGDRGACGDAGRGDGVRRRGRRGCRARPGRTVGGPAARPRPDGHGLAGPGLVSGPGAAPRPVRLQRERGPDGVVERPGGGGWAQRADGEVVWRILAGEDKGDGKSGGGEGVGAEARAAIEAEAARLESWLGTTRVTPRFRTPVEKDLVR